jgi:hypothetical protein
MTQKRSILVLNAVTTAQNSNSVEKDYRFEDNSLFAVAGTLTAGDTINVHVSPNVSGATPDVWVTVATYTSAVFGGTLEGPWPRVRVGKVGTTVPASVYIVG